MLIQCPSKYHSERGQWDLNFSLSSDNCRLVPFEGWVAAKCISLKCIAQTDLSFPAWINRSGTSPEVFFNVASKVCHWHHHQAQMERITQISDHWLRSDAHHYGYWSQQECQGHQKRAVLSAASPDGPPLAIVRMHEVHKTKTCWSPWTRHQKHRKKLLSFFQFWEHALSENHSVFPLAISSLSR